MRMRTKRSRMDCRFEFRFSREEWLALERLAQERGTSAATVLRQALKAAVVESEAGALTNAR